MKIKEKLFCCYYAKLQNHNEAAIKAGYDKEQADMIGIKLLTKQEIKEEIKNIIQNKLKNNLIEKVIAGLERLAFGTISDAIKLVFAEKIEDIKDLSKMDLYNISEIKKIKGGYFEIKFFDRIKALEKIAELSQMTTGNTGILDLYEAIKNSAKTISEPIEEETECNE